MDGSHGQTAERVDGEKAALLVSTSMDANLSSGSSAGKPGSALASTPRFAGRPLAAFAVLAAVNAMWAFQFSGARLATRQLGAVLVTLVPMAIATILILPFAGMQSLVRKPERWLLLDLLLLGTVGIVPAQLCLVLGVERTLASNASILTLTVPVLMAVSASIFLKEQMTRMRWASFAAAIVGVCLISGADLRTAQLLNVGYTTGNLLVLLSCAGSAFYNSYSRRALSLHSPALVLAGSFLVADLELAAICALTDPTGLRKLNDMDAATWGSLLLIAFLSLGASMLLYFAVIQSVEIMQASLSLYLMPVFGLIFSTLLLHEKITSSLVTGSLLIFSSSFVVMVYENRQALSRKRTL